MDADRTGDARRRPRLGLSKHLAALIVVLALVGGTAAGGFAGGAAMRYWLDRPPSAAAAALTRASRAPQTNVALVQGEGTASSVYAAVSPAVVTVSVNSQLSRGPFSQPVQGEGTGVIVDEEGHIVTNNHVVSGARNVSVTLADGTKLSATVAGTDPGSDLAVLKVDIPQDKLTIAALGDSDKVIVGESVVAIGTPFGLDQTLTAGIVSAKNRTFGDAAGRPMRNLIQTDAPINPGNSGGPLLNLQGEVIGITTSIESPVRASVGIGFAIPSNRAKQLLPALTKGAKVDHPWLGISGQAITSALAKAQQLPVTKGVLVAEAVVGGPAAKAGLHGGTSTDQVTAPTGGDIITNVDGREVTAVEEIANYIDTKLVGDAVTLDILRDGKPLQIKVTLGAWPQSNES